MKIIAIRDNKRVIYCQKRDINFLVSLKNSDVRKSIVDKVRGSNQDDFHLFCDALDVEYLRKNDAILSFEQLVNSPDINKDIEFLQESLDKLLNKQIEVEENTLAYEFLEKTISITKYKISTLIDYQKGNISIPPIPRPELVQMNDETHTIYGTFNDKILLIRRNDGKPMNSSEPINCKLITEATKQAVSKNPTYNNKNNFSYEIIPGIKKNLIAILIKPSENNCVEKNPEISEEERQKRLEFLKSFDQKKK